MENTMKIAVVGATGMIGHHTALAVVAAGHELVVIHRESTDVSRLPDVAKDRRVAALADKPAMVEALQGCDAVINCAAYYPTVPKPWQQEVDHAVAEMRNFYAACAELSLNKIVYLGAAIALPSAEDGYGTAEARYSEPPKNKTPYVQVKWALDELAFEQAAQGLPVVIGIPGMTFGEYDWQPTTGRLVVEVSNGRLSRYVPGRRNVIYAGDVGRGLILAAEKGRAGERYLFTNENVLMRELIGTIATAASTYIPPATSLGAAKMASLAQRLKFKMGGPVPLLSQTAIAVMAYGQFLDGKKARDELGFTPEVPLDEVMRRTIRWFRTQDYITV